MDACPRPHVDYPCRVPLKVIGQEGALRPEAVEALIRSHLGVQPAADQTFSSNRKGTYISYTFWVTLPDAGAELPLRQEIQALPGYVMQL